MDGLQAEEEEEEEEETGCENAFWVQLGEEEESDYTLEVVAGEEVYKRNCTGLVKLWRSGTKFCLLAA